MAWLIGHPVHVDKDLIDALLTRPALRLAVPGPVAQLNVLDASENEAAPFTPWRQTLRAAAAELKYQRSFLACLVTEDMGADLPPIAPVAAHDLSSPKDRAVEQIESPAAPGLHAMPAQRGPSRKTLPLVSSVSA